MALKELVREPHVEQLEAGVLGQSRETFPRANGSTFIGGVVKEV